MKIIALIIAWTWIAAPLSWGVYQSVQKSMPLFEGESPPVVPLPVTPQIKAPATP